MRGLFTADTETWGWREIIILGGRISSSYLKCTDIVWLLWLNQGLILSLKLISNYCNGFRIVNDSRVQEKDNRLPTCLVESLIKVHVPEELSNSS